MLNIVLDGIMGVAIAASLGVPAEFKSRDNLLENPVVGILIQEVQ